MTDAIEKSVNTLIGQDNRNFFQHASKCLNQRLAEIGDAGCAICGVGYAFRVFFFPAVPGRDDTAPVALTIKS